jgi:hypothetical protein
VRSALAAGMRCGQDLPRAGQDAASVQAAAGIA